MQLQTPIYKYNYIHISIKQSINLTNLEPELGPFLTENLLNVCFIFSFIIFG